MTRGTYSVTESILISINPRIKREGLFLFLQMCHINYTHMVFNPHILKRKYAKKRRKNDYKDWLVCFCNQIEKIIKNKKNITDIFTQRDQ